MAVSKSAESIGYFLGQTIVVVAAGAIGFALLLPLVAFGFYWTRGGRYRQQLARPPVLILTTALIVVVWLTGLAGRSGVATLAIGFVIAYAIVIIGPVVIAGSGYYLLARRSRGIGYRQALVHRNVLAVAPIALTLFIIWRYLIRH